MKKILVRYSESFGRMGSLEEVFVTTEPEMRALKGIGKCHQGEVLGKHSDITSTLSDATLAVLCDDQEWITRGEKYGVLSGCAFVGRLMDMWDEDGQMGNRWDAMRTALTADELDFVCDQWGLEQ